MKKFDLETIKKTVNSMVDEKISNMTGSEISEELSEWLSDKYEMVAKTTCQLLESNDCVNTVTHIKAMDGLTEDLILDWDSVEDEEDMLYDMLYNYDALWMTAIQKAFPLNVTDTQCNCGTMELISSKRERFITVNGKERVINTKELIELSHKYLPNDMWSTDKDRFIDEVIFRIESLEFEDIDTNGKSIEEYYFTACLAYAEENGFEQFFDEEDDGNIFEYCGAELENTKN